MTNYCASSLALSWAVTILLGQCALFVRADSEQASRDSNDGSPRAVALATPKLLQLGRLHQLERQSYLRKPDKKNDENTGRASDRIMKDLTEVFKSESFKKGIIKVGLVNDNLYEWEVELSITDKDSDLHKDLAHLCGDSAQVSLRLVFNDNYPNEPPFVRVAYPILKDGHVSDVGALCMELISKNGWDCKCSIESLLLSITILMIEGKTRVDFEKTFDDPKRFNEEAARKSFDSIVYWHDGGGWEEV